MKSIKQAIGAMLLAGGAFGLFVACSTEGTTCVAQSDCAADEVCDGSECASTCNATSECDAGYTCEPAASGSGKVCKKGSSGTTGGGNTGGGNTGGSTGTTAGPAGAVYNYLMVRDTTTGGGCDGTDPGSDLMYVNVTDASGTVLGWAETVLSAEGTGTTGTNSQPDFSVLDGTPPSLDLMECIDGRFGDTTVYSMGCGGTLVFKIAQNGTDAPFPVIGGKHAIIVGEYGTGCDGSPDDSYELYGCTDDMAILGDDMSSCTVFIGGAEGLVSFAVPE